MPASMMRAPVGSRPKVIGRRIAIVAMGPTPGKTPINVPTRQPAKQSARFWRPSATEKPSWRLLIRSLIGSPSDERDDGDGKSEQHLEEEDASAGEADGEDDRFLPPHLVARERAEDHGERPGEGEAERPDGEGENQHGP